MADNKSARIISGIPETQSLDFARRIRVWSGGLTTTAQSITIPWANITGIDVLELFFQQMSTDASNGYTGGTTLLVSNITTALKENILPISGLDFSSGKYLACGRYSYQHVGTNLVIKWVNKGWFDVPAMAWNDAKTMDNGLSLVRIEGYQNFKLTDTYIKSEVDALIPKIGTVRTNGTTIYFKADNRDFQAGTVVYFNHSFVGSSSGSEGSIEFSRNTTNTSAGAGNGGGTPGRWLMFVSGTVTLKVDVAKGAEITLGTLSIGSSTGYPYPRSIAYGGM
jgi:hypothetical protein